jgi:hypothetical protein
MNGSGELFQITGPFKPSIKHSQARNDEIFQAIATAQTSTIQIGISTAYQVV